MTAPTAHNKNGLHKEEWSAPPESARQTFGENFPDLAGTDTTLHKAAKAAEHAVDSARTAMAGAADDLSDAAGRAYETGRDAASKAYDAGRNAAGDAYESGKDTFKAIEDYVRANPIPVAIGTAAAGALVALLIANRGRSQSSGTRRMMREMARAGDDMHHALRRELRTALNEERINRIVNALPTNDVSKAVTPWISQVIEALTSAKDQAQSAVASAAGKVQDKLS